MNLTRRARELYPRSRRMAARYVLSARALRRAGRWVHDGAKTTWGAQERRAKPRPNDYVRWPRTAREFFHNERTIVPDYIVKITAPIEAGPAADTVTTERLVRAKNQAQALAHVTDRMIAVELADTEAIIRCAKAGVEIETAA